MSDKGTSVTPVLVPPTRCVCWVYQSFHYYKQVPGNEVDDRSEAELQLSSRWTFKLKQ